MKRRQLGPTRELLALLDRLAPSVRREVERALRRLRRRLSDSQLLDLLERGDAVALGPAIRRFERDLEPALKVLADAFAAGRTVAANVLPVQVRMAFRQMNPLAVRAAESQAAAFVTGVSQETRVAIRTVITEAFKEGIAVRDAARLIRPVIGLTTRQANAVVRQRQADLAKGLSQDVAQARANRYTDKLLKQRALMIARTEVIASATQGQIAAWREAQAEGFLSRQAKAVWITTDDDRACPICVAFDGQVQPVGAFFRVAEIAVQGPPAHPNCRCTLGLDAASLRLRRVA